MPSKYCEEKCCYNCGRLLKIIVTSGIYPMRSIETGVCPECGAEVARKNITGDVDVELIRE